MLWLINSANGLTKYMNQCVIAILDILGTKGIWTEQSIDKYFHVIDKVEKDLNFWKNHFDSLTKKKPFEFDFVTFSDTLIITIINKEKHDYFFDELIEGFSQFILGVFQSYLADNFFLRGAISFGDIEKRGSHFVGPAVDDAAEYFELQDMIGICLTPKTTIAMEYSIEWNLKYNRKKIDEYVIKYKTPLKNKMEFDLYQINWAKQFLDPVEGTEQMNPASRISRFFSVRNIPIIAATKFSNTLKFFDYAIKKAIEQPALRSL